MSKQEIITGEFVYNNTPQDIALKIYEAFYNERILDVNLRTKYVWEDSLLCVRHLIGVLPEESYLMDKLALTEAVIEAKLLNK